MTRHRKKKYFGGSGDVQTLEMPELNTVVSTSATTINYNNNIYILAGTGGFSSVYTNTAINEAIKIIDVAENDRTAIFQNEIVNYYTISTLCNTNYFCKFKNYYIDESSNKIYILMEYCGKNLYSVIDDNYQKLSPILIYKWFLDIANGIQCMHDNNYVHLDIKLDNITIYGNDDINQCKSKMIDFSVAKNIDELTKMNGIYSVGTENYMAPELKPATKLELKSIDYKKCDIYSFGVSLGMALKYGSYEIESNIIKQITPINDIVDDDPSKRPDITFIISELSKIIDNLSKQKSFKDRISFFEKPLKYMNIPS
jgi:serine/threonine protein kinase